MGGLRRGFHSFIQTKWFSTSHNPAAFRTDSWDLEGRDQAGSGPSFPGCVVWPGLGATLRAACTASPGGVGHLLCHHPGLYWDPEHCRGGPGPCLGFPSREYILVTSDNPRVERERPWSDGKALFGEEESNMSFGVELQPTMSPGSLFLCRLLSRLICCAQLSPAPSRNWGVL